MSESSSGPESVEEDTSEDVESDSMPWMDENEQIVEGPIAKSTPKAKPKSKAVAKSAAQPKAGQAPWKRVDEAGHYGFLSLAYLFFTCVFIDT